MNTQKDENKIYAGVGSRDIPQNILQIMHNWGHVHAQRGYVLRSGNCPGADQAFQEGANKVAPHLVELYLPNKNYYKKNIQKENKLFTDKKFFREALTIASSVHLRWRHLTNTGQTFHGRSVQMVLGYDLETPVDFVICWTPEAKEVGGTATGILIAKKYNIPVINLAEDSHLQSCMAKIAEFSH